MAISRKKALVFNLATLLCVLFHKSYRYRFINGANRREAETMHPKNSFVIASWHQNCFAGILAHAGQGVALLVSRSTDGDIVSRLAARIGLQSVRGSSKKGGKEALEVLIELTRSGLQSAFTIDGPKGPIFQIKRGVFTLAAQTGAPVLPTFAIGARYWTLHKSWDKFRIPKPFSRVAVLYGKPFHVTADELLENFEGLQAHLTQELVTLEIQAVNMGLCPSPGTLPAVGDYRLGRTRPQAG